ncbi:EF-Hand 1, calcium-binding site domain-containing protein [Paramicrosporidium saccamoebae]|uniref:EF-Hand 1, calcium-binding site domain-containing protein n=1 Tax=Paramicrosporidium saccamoebae TaxID=1246581 RepID=A0A2H9TJU2_9FUNG|nr:EF-Hand 1, calcium-binding site domain-containing protein [Paramicrosporidium saccamoebae]
MGVKISEDLEDVDIAEVEKEYLLGKTSTVNVKSILLLFGEGVLFTLLALLPAFFVWLCTEFTEYDLVVIKASSGSDTRMEFIRWSVFSAVLYSTYLSLLVSIQIAPSILLWCIESLRGRISYTARRQLHHARNVEHWIAVAVFFIAISFVSARLMYNTSFISTLTVTMSGQTTDQTGDLILERLYVLIVLMAVSVAAGRYLLSVISYSFLQTAFAKRIHICNYKYSVLYRLFSALSRGIPSERKKVSRRSSTVSLAPDTGMDLSSGKRSEEIADLIFEKLCPSTREYLREDDFSPYFDADQVTKAFNVFNVQDTPRVEINEFRESIHQIHEERHNITRSLYCHNHIVRKLGYIFDGLAAIMTVLFGVALFKLQTAAVVVVFGTVYIGLNFAVQTGLRGAYDALHFIFVAHVFDVGDRVIINGVSLLVERIDVFTTLFRQADGTAVYIANSNLTNAKIYNIRRSGHSSELFPVETDTTASTEKIWLLRDALVQFTSEHPREFTGLVEVNALEVVNATTTKVVLQVEFLGNFQNISTLTMRKNLISSEIDRIKKAGSTLPSTCLDPTTSLGTNLCNALLTNALLSLTMSNLKNTNGVSDTAILSTASRLAPSAATSTPTPLPTVPSSSRTYAGGQGRLMYLHWTTTGSGVGSCHWPQRSMPPSERPPTWRVVIPMVRNMAWHLSS